MKKIKYIIFSALVFTLFSCSEDFLDNVNQNNPAQGVIFDNTENAQFALNGLIRSLYDVSNNFTNAPQNGFYEYGGYPTMMMTMDFLGEDIPFVGTSPTLRWTEAYNWGMITGSDAGLLEYHWLEAYNILNVANSIIDNIDGASGPQSIKDNIKGQALAARAFVYFDLVQLFADRYEPGGANNQLGPILYTTATQSTQPRNTVAETYELINSDLDAAMSLLDSEERIDKSYINNSVVLSLKARVALVQEDWQMAINMATAALANYSLMDNTAYQSGFNSFNNDEWIWGWNMEEGARDSNIFASFFINMAWNGVSSDVRANPRVIFSALYDFIPDTDVRSTIFSEDAPDPDIFPGSGYTVVPYHSFKFESEVLTVGDQTGDIPVIRAAEMLLIKAEAEQRSGNDTAAAQTLFNLNSNRDPNYTLSTNTGQTLLDEIWMYRRAELWGEGHRFKDLKRNNLDLDRSGGNHNPAVAKVMNVPASDERWTWLIPDVELDRNPNINSN
ncbi:RagB/SusD family nutrient uptake outer membrane protein [Flavivirga rizhaonensis]|nr:RagB/SusD family nutrient uptake outer membrane protein [Flavivirga rizhaonensis]